MRRPCSGKFCRERRGGDTQESIYRVSDRAYHIVGVWGRDPIISFHLHPKSRNPMVVYRTQSMPVGYCKISQDCDLECAKPIRTVYQFITFYIELGAEFDILYEMPLICMHHWPSAIWRMCWDHTLLLYTKDSGLRVDPNTCEINLFLDSGIREWSTHLDDAFGLKPYF